MNITFYVSEKDFESIIIPTKRRTGGPLGPEIIRLFKKELRRPIEPTLEERVSAIERKLSSPPSPDPENT